MGHVLVLGGARSGKTGFAERLAMRSAANVSQQVRRYRANKKTSLPPRLSAYLSLSSFVD